MPGQLADLRLQPLQRHRNRVIWRGRVGNRAVGGEAAGNRRLAGPLQVEHAFDSNREV